MDNLFGMLRIDSPDGPMLIYLRKGSWKPKKPARNSGTKELT